MTTRRGPGGISGIPRTSMSDLSRPSGWAIDVRTGPLHRGRMRPREPKAVTISSAAPKSRRDIAPPRGAAYGGTVPAGPPVDPAPLRSPEDSGKVATSRPGSEFHLVPIRALGGREVTVEGRDQI